MRRRCLTGCYLWQLRTRVELERSRRVDISRASAGRELKGRHWQCRKGLRPSHRPASNFEIGRILHLKSEIRNRQLNPVQSDISDFGFEMQDSSNFKISPRSHFLSIGLYPASSSFFFVSAASIVSEKGPTCTL